jgi:aldehyde dehydrogenase (NAD+)
MGELTINPSHAGRLVQEQRRFFKSGITRDISFRRERLLEMKDMIRRHQDEILEAAHKDLGKPPFEMFASENAFILSEIDYAEKNLDCWTSPRRVKTPNAYFGARSLVYPEPYGVTLIIAPWNYPFVLLLSPLVGSIAAGNCAVVKPSEISAHSSRIIARMISETFEPQHVAALEGGVEVSESLLEEKFDYIFFTGSGAVGKVVMRAAAEHLTPVTLELGGKSPCIVDSDIRVKYTANRIVFGKFWNAGQTCIAPDYLLVDRSIKPLLLEEVRRHIRSFYGEDPSRSRDYARIVNDNHFQRLAQLLGEGNILIGGDTDRENLYIAPTVIDDLSFDAPIMREEIFGPILPVFAYDDLDEALAIVNSRPKPLSLYFFSLDRTKQEKVLRETSSGGVTINSALLHHSTQTLPFGGVGESGMGAYHGRSTFDTFTHYRGVLDQRIPLDFVLRPPYPGSRIVNAALQRLLVVGRRCRT